MRVIVLSIVLSVILMACSNEVEKPNVLVIMADDAGYADFGFMGSPDLKTPNIDRIANEGVKFTDAHVTGSVCSPSRAGFMTGRYQQRFGHEMNSPGKGLGMDPNELTIADVMRTAGYTTALFGKWHLGGESQFHPNNRGFDVFQGFLGGHRPYFPSKKADKPHAHTAIQNNGEYTTFEGYYTDVLGQQCIDFIDDNKENPFLAILSFNAVHTPMQATEEDLALFSDHSRQKLAAMTWAMDRAVGEVIKKLEEEKLLDNTIVFFLSDNGGSPHNSSTVTPLKGFKGLEFEGGQRVAYAMMWKNQLQGGVVNDQLVSSLDIMATAVAAAGIENTPGKPLDGVDLMPYLKGNKEGVPHEELYWRMGNWEAMRMGSYKYLNAQKVDDILYDLKSDISETTDIRDQETEIHQLMKEKYEKWEEGTIDKLWDVSEGWNETKKYMYRDMFDNKKPRVMSPGQLKKLSDEEKVL